MAELPIQERYKTEEDAIARAKELASVRAHVSVIHSPRPTDTENSLGAYYVEAGVSGAFIRNWERLVAEFVDYKREV
jgi:hypothetical protein